MPAEEAGSAAPGAPGEVERAGAQQAAPGRDVPGKKKTEARAANGPTEPPAALRSAPLRADQAPLGALTRERSERQLTDNRLDLLLKELDKAQPQSWLETIERLRREGRHADADALADEFKRRFPGHPLTRQEDERAR